MRNNHSVISIIIITLIANSAFSSDVTDKQSASHPVDIRITNGEQLELASRILAKTFCVAMRRNHTPETSSALRAYIHPVYLKKHQRAGQEFSFQTVSVKSIFDIQITDDPHTILCLVSTADNSREAIILRTAIHEERLYVSPVRPPHAETGSLTPWILRTKLAASEKMTAFRFTD